MLEKSPPDLQVIQLCESVAIREAVNGNHDTEPALIVYLGCQKSEVTNYVEIFKDYYHCHCCEVRQPQHLKEFEVEIKIQGIKCHSEAFGLDYLIESEEEKHLGCNYDEYNYYATGYLPHW